MEATLIAVRIALGNLVQNLVSVLLVGKWTSALRLTLAMAEHDWCNTDRKLVTSLIKYLRSENIQSGTSFEKISCIVVPDQVSVILLSGFFKKAGFKNPFRHLNACYAWNNSTSKQEKALMELFSKARKKICLKVNYYKVSQHISFITKR